MSTEPYDLDFRPRTYWPGAEEGFEEDELEGALPGETQIAYISIEVGSGDGYSVRAGDGEDQISYRIVNEWGDSDYAISPRSSEEPLTMRELIALLASWKLGDRAGIGAIRDWYAANSERASVDEVADYVVVTSPFYPALEQYYRDEAQAWAAHYGSTNH